MQTWPISSPAFLFMLVGQPVRACRIAMEKLMFYWLREELFSCSCLSLAWGSTCH